MTSGAMFSREEVGAGLGGRRSSTLLFAIENRAAELTAKRRQALASYRTERTAVERERAFLAALASGRASRPTPSVRDLERHAPDWMSLVPPDPDGRATIVHLLAGKYALPAREVPRIRNAFGIDDPFVDAAYRRLYGEPASAALALDEPAIERIRWVAARAAERVESLSPFWMAYVLALTETIGEGILAVPIALAGVGPVPGMLLLLVIGIVNLATIGGLAEAITRDGPMRYGTAYFGRLVRDLLGGVGTLPMHVGLAMANAVILLAYLLGFASVLTGATGVPEAVWVTGLFVVNLVYLHREDLDMTVASAIVVGAANLVLIVAMLALAIPHVTLANLTYSNVPFLDGRPFEPAVWALVLGVVLVAYDGGGAVANASKLVLAADPGGRALLLGNLASLVTVIVMYCAAVLVIGGAVGPTALATTDGTAISPLAAVVGPVIDVLGSIYVVLAIGLGSIYCSLGLYNQVLELLPRRMIHSAEPASRRRWSVPTARFLLGASPLFGVFVLLLAMIFTDTASFAGALSIAGVLIVPFLSGVYPVLLIAAARRKGAYVPSLVIRALGHPAVLGVVSVFFVGSLVLYGVVIWTGPVERVLALGTALLSVGLAVRAYRTGAFRTRLVIEVRVVAGSRVAAPVVEIGLTSAGRALDTDLVDRTGGPGSIRVRLPAVAPEDLEIWVHQVGDDGTSSGRPARVVLDQGEQTTTIGLDDEGRAIARSITRTEAATVTITMAGDSGDRR